MYDFIDDYTLICEHVCYKPHMGFWFDSDNLKLQESNMFKDESGA